MRARCIARASALGAFAALACLLAAGCDPAIVRLGGPGPSVDAPRLDVTDEVDLSRHLSSSRTCAEGGDLVSYPAASGEGTTVTLGAVPGAGCLTAGDEVLLMVMQTSAEQAETVGEHELLRVLAVDGQRLEFVAAPALDLGELLAEPGARIVVQRVPVYERVTIAASGRLTAPAWNGVTGGVLVVRVTGDVVIDGEVDLSGRGFRGGAERLEVLAGGLQGESIAGEGTESQAANFGGGGGGRGDQTTTGCVQDGSAGGGGGHAEAGQAAQVSACDGEGRGEGGLATASRGRFLLGSGGGSGGVDNVRVDNPPGAPGGAGGGLVWILAQSITGTGAIRADGAPGVGDEEGVECERGGSTETCFDHSGPGGGGAGGTIVLDASLVDVEVISVAGGAGGNGFDAAGGNGGDGAPGVVSK